MRIHHSYVTEFLGFFKRGVPTSSFSLKKALHRMKQTHKRVWVLFTLLQFSKQRVWVFLIFFFFNYFNSGIIQT